MNKEQHRQERAKQRHIEEAESAGLVYLGKATEIVGKFNSCYKKYQIKACGHVQEFQVVHVRNNNYSCSVCFEQSLVSAAQRIGFTYLGKVSGTIGKYVRNECGHETICNHQNIKNRRVDSPQPCKQCLHEDIVKIAKEKHNMEYLGESNIGRSYLKFKFISCGHEKDVLKSSIFRVNPVCRICQEDEYASEAELEGLEYVGLASDRNSSYRRYKMPCGCEKDFRMDHIRGGRWCCHVHDEIYYTKPSFVYLTKFKNKEFEWLKLGFSHNIEERTKNYGLSKDTVYEVLATIPYPTGYDAMLFEKSLHFKYKQHRIDKEVMRQYFKNNGRTECYHISVLQEILQELL